MDREVVAQILANPIDSGNLNREETLHIARLWSHANPLRHLDCSDPFSIQTPNGPLLDSCSQLTGPTEPTPLAPGRFHGAGMTDISEI
jgi:hypothetical protein